LQRNKGMHFLSQKYILMDISLEVPNYVTFFVTKT